MIIMPLSIPEHTKQVEENYYSNFPFLPFHSSIHIHFNNFETMTDVIDPSQQTAPLLPNTTTETQEQTQNIEKRGGILGSTFNMCSAIMGISFSLLSVYSNRCGYSHPSLCLCSTRNWFGRFFDCFLCQYVCAASLSDLSTRD